MPNKKYQISIPVFVSERFQKDNFQLFESNPSTLIQDLKDMINNYNVNQNEWIITEKKAKTDRLCIPHIESIDMQFGKDQCLLLRVTAYRTNLLDGYFQSEEWKEKSIQFKTNDKLCSNTYFYLLYPTIHNKINDNIDEVYWHVFAYEDPSKSNEEMTRIIKLIMKKVLKTPIKNVKSDKMVEDIKKYRLIQNVEIVLSSVTQDIEDVPAYIKEYEYQCNFKEEKKITISNMTVQDALKIYEDRADFRQYPYRKIRYLMHNRRVFSAKQKYDETLKDFTDKIRETLEDCFNYNIDVSQKDLHSIFEIEVIKKNIEGVFTRYLAENADE